MRKLIGCLAVICLLAPAMTGALSARADDDAPAIQSVISSQISAFLSGDGELAYSYASPGIKRLFPSPQIFMQMVEQGYEPVFRPRSFAFTDLELNDDRALQLVDIVGPDGAPWTALYMLERQPDGSWRISGCQLKPGVGA